LGGFGSISGCMTQTQFSTTGQPKQTHTSPEPQTSQTSQTNVTPTPPVDLTSESRRPTSLPSVQPSPNTSDNPSTKVIITTQTRNLDFSSVFTSSVSVIVGDVTTATVDEGASAVDRSVTTPSSPQTSVAGKMAEGSSFIHNKAAAGCTFAVIGVLVLIGIAGGLLLRKRRQRKKQYLERGISNLDFKYLNEST